MRALTTRLDPNTLITAIDDPSHGNAHHKYGIAISTDEDTAVLSIYFQKGPIKEVGVNGVQNEDLLAIVIDRLECFQAGDYACEENEIALTYLKDALCALQERTVSRKIRGVEGTSEK